MTGIVDVSARTITPFDAHPSSRALPIESPIAIEYNGIGYAVMMATPSNLEDFAIGFSLSERIIANAVEILTIEPQETPNGWLLKIQIAHSAVAPMIERVRVRVSESSCGLCGLENLEQVNRPLPPISSHLSVESSAVFAALERLRDHQPLNTATGGAHAAAFCNPQGNILIAREDVGRHCAFDKLIGAMARAGFFPSQGFALLSSRCSYELVEKAVIAGFPLLVTLSTATSLAMDRAAKAKLRLIVLARPDAMLGLSHNSLMHEDF
jgi:FdhD protein